jgi:hypothetical protein
MLILECQCGLPTHREGSKGQKYLSANIDSGNMKFGKNLFSALEERIFYKKFSFTSLRPKNLKNDVFGG